jgi:hypothetical protein
MILLISAFGVARITGVSHQCLDETPFLMVQYITGSQDPLDYVREATLRTKLTQNGKNG